MQEVFDFFFLLQNIIYSEISCGNENCNCYFALKVIMTLSKNNLCSDE